MPRLCSFTRSSHTLLTAWLLACVGACDVSADAEPANEELQPFVPAVCGSWNPPAAPPSSSLPLATSCSEGPCFTEVSAAAGLGTVHFVDTDPAQRECIFARAGLTGTEFPREDCNSQWATGGASVGDVDEDGNPDLFMTRLGAPDHLFLGRADGTFEDVAQQVGLDACTWTNGSVFGDIDNDGDLDLLVTSLGDHAHLLYLNLLHETGELRFEEQGEARGFALRSSKLHAGQSVTLGDLDRDGWLDLHVGEWITVEQMPDPSEPDYAAHGGRLLLGTGEGYFEDRTQAYGVALDGPDERGVFAFASTFVDLDEDGWQELVVAVDGGHSRLFWSQEGERYEDGTPAAGVNLEHSAMGSAFGDVDGDGRLDWFVSAIAHSSACDWDEQEPCYEETQDGNHLYVSAEQEPRRFGERGRELGIEDGDWGWGTELFDADNDGDLDIAMTNGWNGRDNYGALTHLDTPTRLWLNRSEAGPLAFEEHAAETGLFDTQQGRTLLSFDYERDGDLDVLIINHAGEPRLFRNDSPPRAWLRVELEGLGPGQGSNRDARGAKVRVQARPEGPWQVREVGVASHFLGEGELIQHFGLGEGIERVHRVEIEWPASGATQVLEQVEINQTLQLREQL